MATRGRRRGRDAGVDGRLRPDGVIGCGSFPCGDVKQESFRAPPTPPRPDQVSIVLVSECAPADPADHYYSGGDSLFEKTTIQAFRDAGVEVSSIEDLTRLGVYLTCAVKCAKRAYGIRTDTVRNCSLILDREIARFPKVAAFLLMGDVAIKALNQIAVRAGGPRVIPAGSTYKIRGGIFHFKGARVFPSYLQAGPSFFIEKSKRRMIAEDIAAAVRVARGHG